MLRLLEVEWTEIVYLERCPYVLQGMHNLNFSFWEEATKF